VPMIDPRLPAIDNPTEPMPAILLDSPMQSLKKRLKMGHFYKIEQKFNFFLKSHFF